MEAKAATPRKIELICLKNRFGISSYSCKFNYYPKNDWFEPDLAGLDISDADTDTDEFVTVPEGFELPWSL